MLAYYGKLGSIESFQNLPVGELNWHLQKLSEVKKKEQEEREKQARQMRSKAPQKTQSPGAFRPSPSRAYRKRR